MAEHQVGRGGGAPHHGPGGGGRPQGRGGGGHAAPDSPHFTPPPEAVRQRIVTDETGAELLVGQAEALGRFLVQAGVKANQIRNLFTNIKKLEVKRWNDFSRRQALMIKPRLAYAVGRQRLGTPGRQGLEALQKMVNPMLDVVTDDPSLNRFSQFFEAVLAYHKAFGGGE